ncbi:MAG: carboxypeptidase regulatory-like domain-containing protein, partial [Acidobacteriota bacterium]
LVMCLLLAARTLWAGEITGRITLNDKPVAGVTVSALPVELAVDQARREARREPRPEAVGKAVTNSKGEFRIVFETVAGQPGRLLSLACAGGGLASAWIPGRFDSADVDDAGEFAARRGVSLSGRVMDAAGKGLADVQVEHPTGPESVRTGADGTFAFEGVAEAGNAVTAWKPGFVDGKASNVRGGAKDVTIVLRAGLPLVGVVLAADGTTPVPGAVVRVDRGDVRAASEADAEGRFTVAAFGPGRIIVFADGGTSGVREVTGIALPRREDEPLRLVLAPASVLAGRVVDATSRKPVAGAVVDVFAGRRTWARAGADGTFVLRPAPSGDFRLTALAPRYAPASRAVAAAEAGGKPVEVFVRPAATVSGRVVDEQRRPVPGARIRAFDPEVRSFLGPPPSAVAGEDGSFTLRRVPASETVRALASHPDFEPLAVADLGLKPAEARAGLTLTLRRGAVVTGVVTAGGEPLAGAQAALAPGRTAYGTPPRTLAGPGWSWPRAVTGADGRFRLAGLSPGEYSLTVSRTGWATETREALVAEGKGPDPYAIALVAESIVAGRIVGKKGGGVAAQHVNAQSAEAKDRSSGFDRSGPDGSFRIDGLKPGVAYNLYLYGTGANTPKATVTPPAERVEIVVNGTGRLTGRVVDPDGRPVTAYQVTAQADRSASSSGWFDSARQTVASETGEFSFENVQAAALEVRVVAKGYQVGRVGGIVVEEGETKEGVEVRLSRGSSLKGRVVEARGGALVAGAEVSAESAPARAVADSDGAFEFEALAPGKVRVTATSPEFVAASETVEVGESGGTVELKMSPGASISAVVVTPGGEPVAAAEVALAPGGQSWSNTRSASGADGRVRFSHLIPGRFSLTAGSAGRRSKPVDVTLEADQARDDVRIVMGGGATVVVSVAGLAPDERRQLSVGVAGKAYTTARELPDGRFEARDVPAGKAQVYARTGNYDSPNVRNVSRPVDVPEDGTLDVEVPFEAGFTLTVRVVKDGQGVEGVFVNARAAAADTATHGQGTTDATGTCRMPGLKAGSYRVNAQSWSTSAQAPEKKVDLSGDQTLEIALPSGRLAGRVVASGSQQPLSNASVSVKSKTPDGTFGLTHDATTDDAGRFQLAGLEEGLLTLTATRKGYVVETRAVSADTPDELVIALARGDGLDVTGRDGLLGTPLATLSVVVFDGAGAEVLNTFSRLDSAGRGEIPSLKPGTYSIVAGGWSGYAPSKYEGISVPGPSLAVSLTPGGTLDVDVPADRLKAGPLACVVTGPRGRLAFRIRGNRGDLSIYSASTHLTNFPPVSGTLACPGSAPVMFTVTEGGTARIAVK